MKLAIQVISNDETRGSKTIEGMKGFKIQSSATQEKQEINCFL